MPENPTSPIVKAGIRFTIPGDRVKKAISTLPPEQSSAIWWFAGYCRSKDLDRSALANILRKPGGGYYSYDSIYQLLTGRRTEAGAGLDAIVAAINAFREIEEKREMMASAGFIETRLAKEVYRRCHKALLRRRIGFIFGDSQIGKTEALKQFQKENNHGQTIYVEVPTGATLSGFLKELCRKLMIGHNRCLSDLKARIIECFDGQNLLIVDEAHRCFKGPRAAASSLVIFDFLRELYNKSRPGIVIAMTNEGRDELLHGNLAKALEQIWRRRISPLQLPSVPFDDDLDLFAKAFGLGPATDEKITVSLETIDGRTVTHSSSPRDLQTECIKADGLGVWISILEDASDIAAEAERPMAWGAVIKAYCLAQAEAEILV